VRQRAVRLPSSVILGVLVDGEVAYEVVFDLLTRSEDPASRLKEPIVFVNLV
jgi:hypothetical protein